MLTNIVVGSSSPHKLSALLDYGGRNGTVAQRSTSCFESSLATDGVGRLNCSGVPIAGCNIRAVRGDIDHSKNFKYETLSSRVTNGLHRLAFPMGASSVRPEAIHSQKGMDVAEVTEFKKSITREVKDEVLQSDRQQMNSLNLDLGGFTNSMSLKEYLEHTRDFVKETDKGPPRWFCSTEATGSPADAPVLLFLPGNWSSLGASSVLI
jgi:hypothetical protein